MNLDCSAKPHCSEASSFSTMLSEQSQGALSLQGTTEHYPPGTLSRLASKTVVDPKDLSTLTVSSPTKELYLSILDYAALYQADQDSLTIVPLSVLDEDAFVSQENEEKNVEEEDDEHPLHFFCKDVGKPHAPVPLYKMGFCEREVVWPPPRHLQADVLSKAANVNRDAEKKGRKMEVSQDKEDECCEKEGGSKIYVVHYSYGPPMKGFSEFSVYREILLASADGAEVLRRFTKEVIKWKIDKEYIPRDGSHYQLYRYKTNDCGGNWISEGNRKARLSSSVVLQEGELESIIGDVRNFLCEKTATWYWKHGLPFRRSYLFYGPPGTGKTSTIQLIASMFRLNCCFLSVVNSKFSNQDLADALSSIRPNPILVLEDVDSLFDENRQSKGSTSLTFSGMLNALDGVISREGVLTIMTTNFIDRLDGALIRGGRVDRRFAFALPELDELKRLFSSFYPEATEELRLKFAREVLGRPEGNEARCIATLQQFFVKHKDDSADDCVAGLSNFFLSHFPNGI